MFSRTFITVLMTALTVLCPFLPCEECCGGCGVRGTSEIGIYDAPVLSECESDCCCSYRTEDPSGESSGRSNKSLPGGGKLLNCFCGGAVVLAPVDLPDPESFSHFVDRSADSCCLAADLRVYRGITAWNGAGGYHFPPLIDGKGVCIFTGTFLL